VLLALITFGAGVSAAHLYGLYHLRAARDCVAHYHTQEAQAHLQVCVLLRGDDPEVLLLVARTARRMGEHDTASDALDRYEQKRGADEDLILERMLLRAERGDIDPVRKFFWAHIKEGTPDAPLILEALARSFIHSFRFGEAEGALDRWLELQPDNVQALYLRGHIYEQRQLRTEAADSYRRVIEQDPFFDDARLKLAAVLVDLGRGKEAAPHLEYLRSRRPNDPQIDINLARSKDLMGQQDEAIRLLDELLQRQPSAVDALLERGKLAMRLGKHEEAEGLFRRAVEIEPGTYNVRFQLYSCLARQGKTAEADAEMAQLKPLEEDMRAIEQILSGEMQRNPHDPALHYKVAMIAVRAGRYQEAVHWLRNALREDPSYAPAHKMMAVYYRQTGNLGLAARHRELARASSGAAAPPGR
jgi:Flp pilus assembly protein TadD